MRISKEILQKIEGEKPQERKGRVLLWGWDASGEDIEGVNIFEVDGQDGRLLKIWTYEATGYERIYDDNGYLERIDPKNFKLNEITELSYQPSLYQHPLFDKQIEVEVQEIRCWRSDKLGRKRRRLEASKHVVVFNDFWDPKNGRPRGYQVLEERVFEPPERQERVSVGTKTQWVEKQRSFLFNDAMIVYLRNADGKMVLWRSNVGNFPRYGGMGFPKGLELPLGLGEAGFIDF